MYGVLQPVLSVGMIEHTRENHRPARAAARGGAIGIAEPRAVGGQRIEVRRLDDRVPIAARVLPLVIGHDENHIPRIRNGHNAQQKYKQ
jgi:hypothetical protein